MKKGTHPKCFNDEEDHLVRDTRRGASASKPQLEHEERLFHEPVTSVKRINTSSGASLQPMSHSEQTASTNYSSRKRFRGFNEVTIDNTRPSESLESFTRQRRVEGWVSLSEAAGDEFEMMKFSRCFSKPLMPFPAVCLRRSHTGCRKSGACGLQGYYMLRDPRNKCKPGATNSFAQGFGVAFASGGIPPPRQCVQLSVSARRANGI